MRNNTRMPFSDILQRTNEYAQSVTAARYLYETSYKDVSASFKLSNIIYTYTVASVRRVRRLLRIVNHKINMIHTSSTRQPLMRW